MADLSQTATAVIAGPNARRILNIILAETVVAGMPAYKTTSGTYGKADGNDAVKCRLIGYFEQGGAAGQRANIVTQDDAAVLGITFAVGDVVVLSAAAGMWAPAADESSGNYVVVAGVATSTTTLNFQPVGTTAVKA